MQSENLHIDEFIRQRESEWTPDHSQQDVHWEKMSSMLVKPASAPPRKRIYTSRRIIRYLGGFAIVTTLTFITYNATKSKKNTATESKVIAPRTAIAPVKRLPQKNYAPRDAANVLLPASTTSYSSTPVHNNDRSIKPANILQEKVTGIKEPAVETPPPAPDATALLNDFYKRIEKPEQEFYVLTARDTMLIAKEGTRLSIPSNAFTNQSGKVKTGIIKIVLTEYYKYDDMVAAKLNTTCNGEQLVTGGMVQIRAFSDGEELKVAPKKNIDLAIPTSNYDKRMQMFIGVPMPPTLIAGPERRIGDSMSVMETRLGTRPRMNWVLAGERERPKINDRNVFIDVLDLSVDPHKVSYGTITRAKFLVNRSIDLSNEEIKEELKKRYGTYYDKIKIRRVSRRNRSSYIDSTVMPFETAMRLKLVSKADSVRKRAEFDLVAGRRRSTMDTSLIQPAPDTLKYYRFVTNSLGWINCDRFADTRNNVYFTLNLGEGYNAGQFYTQLIFTRYRSIMAGYGIGNRIQFENIPANEPVQLITVGVKDGKVVSCIQSLTTSKNEVRNLILEETTPQEFRKKLESLNITP